MAAAVDAPAWKTFLGDSIGLVLAVWAIPVAILLVGAPIVLLASLLINVARWLLT
jgi:hypothetical protein